MKWQRQLCPKSQQMLLRSYPIFNISIYKLQSWGNMHGLFWRVSRVSERIRTGPCGMQDVIIACLLHSFSDTSYVCLPVQYMVVPEKVTHNSWSKITFAAMILHCSYKSGMIMNTMLKQVYIKHHTHKTNYIKHQRVCEFVHQTRTSCFRLYLPQISWPSNAMSKPIMASCNQGWNK